MENKKEEIRNLVTYLNNLRDKYYNENISIISDYQYDMLMDKLDQMEKETGIIFTNSPTQSVGYKVVSELKQVVHNHPMLSLDKTHDVSVVQKYFKGRSYVMMPKMDGLTCTLWYSGGKLVRAETRGDGHTGEDITHNAPHILGIPLTIPYSHEIIIDGEVIITKDTFRRINDRREVSGDEPFKHPRNLAAGSVRQLNSRVCAERKPIFIAWKYVKGSTASSFAERLKEIDYLNMKTVRYYLVKDLDNNEFEEFRTRVEEEMRYCDYPIDGLVLTFDDIEYGESLGHTEHHFYDSLAFKFYEDRYDTIVRNIDWTMGKTGVLTPTAIFDTVNIDGTDVSRASLHNLTIMENLNIKKNCTAYVYKANDIIPQIDYCDNDSTEEFTLPNVCPVCGGPVKVVKDNDAATLVCDNPDCEGKLLGKLSSFVSKNGMDIEGLSKSTLAKFIDSSYVNTYSDIYELYNLRHILIRMEGFGPKSIDKILNNIEQSRDCSLSKFLSAINIPNISTASAKLLAQKFDNDWDKLVNALENGFDFSTIEGFGEKTNIQIHTWYDNNKDIILPLASYMRWSIPAAASETFFTNRKFCISGSFDRSRDEIKAELESYGGVFVSDVSKKVEYLFAGAKSGSKLNKAKELGITIVEAADYDSFIQKLRGES